MVSSDFRKIAREKLAGKWGKAAIISLLYVAFYFVLGCVEGILGLSDSSIAGLINIVIEIPIIYGFAIVLLKLFNDESYSTTDMFSLGFSNFKRAWQIQLYTLLKLAVPIIIIVVAGILMGIGAGVAIAGAAYSSVGATGSGAVVAAVSIVLIIVSSIWITVKSYYYQLAVFIGIDNPDMPAKEVVEKSQELMTGNRWKLFCLELSFIGWAFLTIFTLGIGYLWLVPYMAFAQIAFYKYLSGNSLNVDYAVTPSENTVNGSNISSDSNSSNINPVNMNSDNLSSDSAINTTDSDNSDNNNTL